MIIRESARGLETRGTVRRCWTASSPGWEAQLEDWRAVAEVHGERFREIRPVNTIVQVSRFIDPDRLVETEVDAVLGAT